MSNWLALLHHESFAAIDREFGRFCARKSPRDCAALTGFLAGLTSHARAAGDSCLDLVDWAGRELSSEWLSAAETALPSTLPDLGHLENTLIKSPMVGSGDSAKPLVLMAHKLYLYRYWEAETTLCRRIKSAITSPTDPAVLNEAYASTFKGLFGPFGEKPDWQAVAAFAAGRSNFCLITGGPGTGKTTTVVRLLALLLQQEPKTNVAVAAPTGKAVARLNESLQAQIETLPSHLADPVPREAQTVHRLLEYRPTDDQFGYHAARLLPHQIVVIDEASMVDTLLMAALVRALPATTRLILLGDHQQLASVDAGNVLADLCRAANAGSPHSLEFSQHYRQLSGQTLEPAGGAVPPLRDSVVVLQHSHRFDDRTGIGGLSAAIRRGDADSALKILEDDHAPEVQLGESPTQGHQLLAYLEPFLERYYAAKDLETAFKILGEFQLLTGMREGRWGVAGLNLLVEQALIHRGTTFFGDHYDRRPMMVTRNDYSLGLFNGDIGICWMGERGLQAAFPTDNGQFRFLPLVKLPPCESAWALTIHKSQGSEFENVLLILPPHDHPLCTRELLYTGLTRAKRSATLLGSGRQVRQAVENSLRRVSGLRDCLEDDGEPTPGSENPKQGAGGGDTPQ